MVKIEMLALLFTCALVCAIPFEVDESFREFFASVGLDYISEESLDDDVTNKPNDAQSNNDTSPEANITDNPWDCSESSSKMMKCVLKTNTTQAQIVYFKSEPGNVTIPNKPPKGVAAAWTETKIDGSLESFCTKMDNFIKSTLGLIKGLLHH